MRNIDWFAFSTQSKDLRQQFVPSFSMVQVAPPFSGRSSCPEFPRWSRLCNGVADLIATFLMLIYAILLQWLES